MADVNQTPTTLDAGELLACPNDDAHGAFWSKVDKQSAGECWPWTAARNKKGYGNFRSRSAHVVSFEIKNGPVPIGLEIDHTCKNRRCVNPAHLEAVTHAENVRRSQVTHCRRGHPLSGNNIRLDRRVDGVRRRCIACRKLERSHG